MSKSPRVDKARESTKKSTVPIMRITRDGVEQKAELKSQVTVEAAESVGKISCRWLVETEMCGKAFENNKDLMSHLESHVMSPIQPRRQASIVDENPEIEVITLSVIDIMKDAGFEWLLKDQKVFVKRRGCCSHTGVTGLQTGDQILEVNGTSIGDVKTLERSLSNSEIVVARKIPDPSKEIPEPSERLLILLSRKRKRILHSVRQAMMERKKMGMLKKLVAKEKNKAQVPFARNWTLDLVPVKKKFKEPEK